MTAPIVLVVTGSRFYKDRARIRRDLAKFPHGTLLLHGDCVYGGADILADQEARALGFVVTRVPVDSDIDRTPTARNLRMVRMAVALVESGEASLALGLWYPRTGDQNRGTRNCARYMREHAIEVINEKEPWS